MRKEIGDPNPLKPDTGYQLFDNQTEFEQPLDVEGIARFLGKKPNTIRNWVASGSVKIPHFLLGNKTMFFISSVVEWCRSLERENKTSW